VDVMTQSKELAEHFFRHEYSRMVAVITRYFGIGQVGLAEDVVQDTLLEAIKFWDYKGIPDNPKAWLYTVAKNKALNAIKRKKFQNRYENETRYADVEQYLDASIDELFAEQRIADDQLRMIFACCHPAIAPEAQIALILKTLCGLSISEIAKAYLTTNETINKRLVRARKTLRQNDIQFEIPSEKELEDRLNTVLKTIYLLFNEGYSATNGSKLIRYELCMDAIRLAELIISHSSFKSNTLVHALLALMLLDASRFEARQDEEGNIIEMAKQDRSKWSQALINKGLYHLGKIQESRQISIYHVLATISAYHCSSPNYESTNWGAILSLYDTLIIFDHSPIVLLNRAIAVAKIHGSGQAIAELVELESTGALENYYLLHSTLAELYIEQKQYEKAANSLEKAVQLTRNDAEIRLLTSKLERCKKELK
jgi:RNA polymerase sigma-70 factor (ECF subfamily)